MSTISLLLPLVPDNFSTQIASSSVAANALTFNVDSATGLPQEGVGQLFKKDTNGDVVAGSIEFIHWTSVVDNTINLTNTGDRGITGSDSGAQAYSADDYFEVWVSSYYQPFTAMGVEHGTDGKHTSAVVTTLKAAASDVTTGTNDTKIVTPKALRDATHTFNKPVINGTNPTGATYTPATGAQTVALDCALNNIHIVTGHVNGSAITFTVANVTNNQPFIVMVVQGSGTVSTITSWFAGVSWVGGVTPTLTATLSKTDTFAFIRTGTNTYIGYIVGQNA
jgi:hypothetical protein